MSLIYHITTRGDWLHAQRQGVYRAPSLIDEGFIHCSTLAQVTKVANAFYQAVPDLVLLVINTADLESEIRWEAPAHPNDSHDDTLPDDDEQFPHVYGTITLDAVQRVIDLPPNADGTFDLPPEIHEP